ncbi:helix-turn-helix domain-containing protein [Rhodobacteraceae bacterium N5(2021)]|uniref:Helix-turn-helix domain-containing protein n=1 Tax=Gymnodinialimonas phycosphaerae TaxID=2841589 RepID=A0A975TYJ5_9RHOB|nr:helix-turn-helix transcriptional regulator [Gymnodinialimonas phycosphaerae]MBY4892931.1 helix-turn-helix domain-containing protein [Gymnodinialimonas phycosphaerae]
MLTIPDKRSRAQTLRDRLGGALTASSLSRAALARAVGVDRSTITQMLAEDDARMPGGHVVACCAQALDVSADWLLGLTDKPEQVGKLLASSLSISETGRATTLDDQIFEWQREAEGYKIRHVPATLPDILKTDAMLRWEYAPLTHRRPDEAIQAAAARLDFLALTLSDYEMAMPVHELESFARAEGYYTGLSARIRAEQLDWMAEIYDRLYPGLRVFLYDARTTFSAPVTVFGPKIAVIYMGRHYLAFRDRDRVRAMTLHFDGLVREAEVASHTFMDRLKALRGAL